MFNEKRFKITIILTKIRRYLFIFFFVILCLLGAYFLSEFLTEIARMPQKYATYIMIGVGVSVFVIGFILTSNLSFKVQQAQLEMKILKRLNLVSFKLDKLLEKSGISISEEVTKELQQIASTPAVAKTNKLKKMKKFKGFKNFKKNKKIKEDSKEVNV